MPTCLRLKAYSSGGRRKSSRAFGSTVAFSQAA